ncbi:NAD-dependent epimerase/dehydratase family protein [Pseudohoeflea coraliihabitans]|nr:NAD(P)-dependent oxidoreductase [Pseudohoeflea sp. DP4N28-3]
MKSAAPVLVVGAAGFIGSQVCQALRSRGLPFFGISRDAIFTPQNHGLCRTPGDPLKFVGSRRWKAVIFVAGSPLAHDAPDATDAQARSVDRLLMQLSPDSRPVFVYASSALVYGRRKTVQPLAESAALQPGSPYAESKLICEDLLLQEESGKNRAAVRIARLFNVAGRGQQVGIIADLAGQVAEMRHGNRETFFLRSDGFILDLTDVRDVANGLIDFACAPKAPTIVNLCSGRPLHAADLVEAAQRVAGRPAPCEFGSRGGPAEALIGDGKLAADTLGWRPHYTVDETLDDAASNHPAAGCVQ